MRRSVDPSTSKSAPTRARMSEPGIASGIHADSLTAAIPSPRKLSEDARLDLFVALSETLLDVSGLPRTTALAFMTIVERASPSHYGTSDISPMDAILLLFERLRSEGSDDLERRAADLFYADLTLGPVVKNILIVWYNGSLGGVVGPIETYADALVWKAISAEAPGLPGPYFGSWATAPPQPIVAPGDV